MSKTLSARPVAVAETRAMRKSLMQHRRRRVGTTEGQRCCKRLLKAGLNLSL
jgi:hypothetical protein